MKIILIYDISSSASNLNKIRKICTKYLLHIQFSVFEGDLENHEIEKLKKEIKNIINTSLDSVILYNLGYVKKAHKQILGINKNDFDGYNI